MPDLSIALVRAIHIASCMLLVALFAIPLLVLEPALRAANAKTGKTHNLGTWLPGRIAAWTWGVGIVSEFVWLWLAAASMSGNSPGGALNLQTLKLTLTETQFGHLWAWRLMISAIIGATLVAAGVRQNSPPILRWLGLSTSTGLLTTLAWAGHAGAGMEQGGTLHLVGDVLHLLAAGFWPAGLLPFAFFLATVHRSGEPLLMGVAAVAARRFSAVSLIAVATLSATGLVNSWFLVGTISALLNTSYGHWLLLKLLLFAGMLTFGAWNLLYLSPRLGSGLLQAAKADFIILRSLQRSVATELLLGSALVAVVGVLGITAPAVQ